MPQLEFSTYTSQIFWLLVTFALFFVIVSNFIVPNLRNIITSRSTKIESDLLQAEQLKKNAMVIYNNIEQEHHKSRTITNKKIQDALTATQLKILEAIKKQEQEMTEKTQISENKMKELINSSQEELKSLSYNTVNSVLSRFISVPINENTVDKYLENAEKIYKK